MLDDLLTVKRRREDRAMAAVAEAKRSLERQQQLLETKSRELADYQAWRKEEAERLFEAVRHQQVARNRLERYRQDVALLQQRELQLQKELAAQERTVEAAEADLSRARAQRQEAHKEVVKFEEYQKQTSEEQALEAVRKEEAELEDILTGQRS